MSSSNFYNFCIIYDYLALDSKFDEWLLYYLTKSTNTLNKGTIELFFAKLLC